MNIVDRLLSLFRSDKTDTQGAEKLTQSFSQIVFRLMYKKNEIGTLTFDNNSWVFVYSDWFKNQSAIKPFSNFPDVNQKYDSVDLPPFFESRIPGYSQPHVEAFLAHLYMEKPINEVETKAALLKKFGRFTITNPFELQSAF